MRSPNLLSIFFSACIFPAAAQIQQATGTPFREGPNCKTLSITAADDIASGLATWDTGRIDDALKTVVSSCGISEVSLRIRILVNIMKREDTSGDIHEYFNAQYYNRTIDRIHASAFSDYGYRYTNNESWYSFVPLRHAVDSTSGNVAAELLDVRLLTSDERLLCLLFSGNDRAFETEWYKSRQASSYAATYLHRHVFEEARSRAALVLYSGTYMPVGPRKIFGPNPTIGVTLSMPFDRVDIGLGIKFRLLVNDQTFKYYALDTVNEVDSNLGLFFGAICGVNLYERKNFIVQSRFGLGLESISTGLSGPGGTVTTDNPKGTEYYDVATLHTSAGLAAMKGIFRGKYIGVEAGLHVCPYGWDKDLRTPLDNVAASGELFFRF